MNLQQLITKARYRLDDNKTPQEWSNDELKGYLNEAINEAAIRSRCIIDSTTEDCCLINVTAGSSAVTVHPSVFDIKRVYDTTNKLELSKISYDDLDKIDSNWQSKTGKPTHYVYDLNHIYDGDRRNSVTLYPVPESSLALNLTVYRTSLNDLDLSDTPEIPEHQHNDLIWWVCYLAFMRMDINEYGNKSQECERQFTIAFGEKQNSQTIEFRRINRHRRVVPHYF